MANGQMAMPRWRRWLPYSIPIRNRTPRREPATSPDPSQDATCVVPPYTGRETVDSPRRPVPLPKRSRSGSATIRSVPPRMKYPDGTHCDRPRLGAAGSTSSVFGARDRGLAPDTVRHQEPAHAMLKCAVERRVFLVVSTAMESCTGLAIENCTLGGGDEPLVRRFLLCSCSLSLRG